MKTIDLSATLHSGMDVYPGDPEVIINRKHTHEEEGWELRELQMGTHSGTHVDSFSHMHKNKASIDEIPIDRFFGPAQAVRKSENWPNAIGLLFKDKMTMDSFKEILKRNPSFVGGDISEDLERALLRENIITYTGLVNLEKLPVNKIITFYGIPLKIKEGDGSPVRAIAVIE